MDYRALYTNWLQSNVLSDGEKNELITIKDDDNEIKERFSVSLAFGTAGMRGVLGMGTNRMNRFVVARATRGLSEYIKGLGGEAMKRGVVIAYDTRNFSTEFAIICAEVLNGYNIKSYLFESVRPVPVCSFAVRHYNAVAGIMITASHNPKIYNGYKVYGSDGAQMSPEDTDVVVNYIEKQDNFFLPVKDLGLDVKNIAGKDGSKIENVEIIGKSLDEQYFKAISTRMLSPDEVRIAKDKIKIVYTPIHGSGYMPVTTILKRMEMPVVTVPEQVAPDGDFPTVKVPNPENADALSLAVKLAEEIGSNVVIGTDPDCDRMGVAVRDDSGKFILLNGNQTGVLLLDYILRRNAQKGTLPVNAAVVRTIVTTRLADKVAESYGAKVFSVLTGFKFIGEKIKEWEQSGEYSYMFGFEESYGSLSGTHARDKDAVVAAMLFAEMACYEAANGSTVYDRLQSIYKQFGYYNEQAFSFTFAGLDGMKKMADIMDYIRTLKPVRIGGDEVEYISDYSSGRVVAADGRVSETGLPKTNAVFFGLKNNGWVCVRPSGTEPKLKVYLAAAEKDKVAAAEKIDDYKGEVKSLFGLR